MKYQTCRLRKVLVVVGIFLIPFSARSETLCQHQLIACEKGISLHEFAGFSAGKAPWVIKDHHGRELHVAKLPIFTLQRRHVRETIVTEHELQESVDTAKTMEVFGTIAILAPSAAGELSEILAANQNTWFVAVCEGQAVATVSITKPFLGIVDFEVRSREEAQLLAATLADRIIVRTRERVVPTPLADQ